MINIGFAPTKLLEILATLLIHIPGLRGNPERSYKTAAISGWYPGSFEKYVASIIHHWQSDSKQSHKLETLVKHLQAVGLVSAIKTNRLNQSQIEIQVSRAKQASDLVNIADVGFGVSQTLPVLVALLAAGEDQLVYIEQPELHLHPNAQFKLAEIIADAVTTRNIKVIIETHSAILIRGIQILVAKGELKPETVSLNWFSLDPESGQTDITTATLDKYGAFGDWPEDFDSVALYVEGLYLDTVEKAMFDEI